MNLDQSVAYIHSLYRKGAKPGLHRMRQLLQVMGNPEKHLKFVHIAGTNGKGSTASMTASILTQAGYRTALFTSPYIYRFHERLQIDGEQIADADVVDLVALVKPLAEVMEDRPTEFEFVTCMAMEYFRRQGCDLVVLEVGMGGALDATNIVENTEVAVITNIGLDHTDVLGNTVEEIAAHKAGIIKEGCHTVVYRGTAGVEAVYEQVCKEKNSKLIKADFDSIHLLQHSLEGQVFDCGSHKALSLPLLGDHQLHNASVVLSVMDALTQRGYSVSDVHIRQGMAQVQWPGRFDIVSRDPLFIIDGGHNPQCIDALVKNISDYLAGKKVIALTGVLADKDYGEMFRPVMDQVDTFVCITPDNPRNLPAAELAAHLQRAGAEAIACESTVEAVLKATELAGPQGAVLCFGSLYSIGAIRSALEEIRSEI